MKEEVKHEENENPTLKQIIELNEDEAEELDDEEIEKNLKLPSSFEEIKEENYPLFLTVKWLLVLIDGTIKYPFFCRRKNKLIGSNINAEWHNE